jgi:hypothetical protein
VVRTNDESVLSCWIGVSQWGSVSVLQMGSADSVLVCWIGGSQWGLVPVFRMGSAVSVLVWLVSIF